MAPSAFLEDLIRNRPSLTSYDYLQERLNVSLVGERGQSFVELLVEESNDTALETKSDSKHYPFPMLPTSPLMARYANEAALPLVAVYEEKELTRQMMTRRELFKLIFIRQRNSISPLNINHQLLTRLLQLCHASSRLFDFIIYFGPKQGETTLTPPSVWTSPMVLATDNQQVPTPFECAYIIRFPELNHRSESNPWSMRQVLIYHQLPSDLSAATVIFAGIGKAAERSLRDYILYQESMKHIKTWEIPLVLLTSIIASWRPYITYLSEEVTAQADGAVLADLNGDGVEVAQLEERQYLKQLEDALDEAVSVLDHTADTAETIQENIQLLRNCPAIVPTWERNTLLDHGFRDAIKSLKHYRGQVQTLYNRVRGTSDLVSNILDLNNSHALKILALESAQETAVMHQLTKKATQDAAAVKVLTVLTLIYLPATVLSNFFSTSFVNTITTEDGSTHLIVASNWWIFVTGALPLTGITLYIWWFYVQREINGQYPTWWRFVQQKCQSAVKATFTRRRRRDAIA